MGVLWTNGKLRVPYGRIAALWVHYGWPGRPMGLLLPLRVRVVYI